MLDTIYVVTDLGPGDGGKGSIVHSLCQEIDAAVVIKRGGAQGSHGVRTSQGESFNFSQWGCGTLEGIPTYCSPQMIISPVGLENESNALKYHGIYDPFTLLSISPTCLCSTPYHMISSQLEELSLGENHRGTIGTGVGRAYRMYQQFDTSMSIFAADLKNKKIIQSKLQKQKDHYRELYRDMDQDNGIAEDKELIRENLDLLYDDGLFNYTVSLFEEIGKKIRLVELSEILQMDGTAVVECSHGVLTDSQKGFKPHVSAIRTLPSFTNSMLREAGFQGRITNLAVHRAYEIRHGAGPMPTYDPEFTEQMLPGSHKEENRWQGIVRAGPLDAKLLQHAVSICTETKFDGLCLTWMDQILTTSKDWWICRDYKESLINYKSIVEYFKYATPVLDRYPISTPIHQDELFNSIKEIVMKYVDIPLKLLSIGSTEKDKIIKLGGNHHG